MSDNELIAEFMGLDWKKIPFECGPGRYRECTIEDLNLYKTWNWLMPVVEKIRKYVIDECPFGNEYYDALCIALIEVNIHDCHFEVVEFIKWYNQNK